MQAAEILAQARSGAYPSNWTVFPILRKKLQWGIAGWAFGTIIGLGLFALVLPIVIPDNFQHGPILIIFTLLMLGMFLFIGLGSLWTLVVDIKRLLTSDKHIFVFTPEILSSKRVTKSSRSRWKTLSISPRVACAVPVVRLARMSR